MKQHKNSKQRFDDHKQRVDIALMFAFGGLMSFLFFYMLWSV